MKLLKSLIRRLGLMDLARLIVVWLTGTQRKLVRIGVLNRDSLRASHLILLGNAALARGNHKLALDAYGEALARQPEDVQLRLQLGVTAFLHGDYPAAERWFISSEQAKQFAFGLWGVPDTNVRVLDPSWLLAIGHVAFLDTYIKAARLGWFCEKKAVLAYDPGSPPYGWPMFRYFQKDIEIVPAAGAPATAVDMAIHGKKTASIDADTRANIRAVLSRPFWYGPDQHGRTRWFAPFGAAVEEAWRATGNGPIARPDPEERRAFRRAMAEVFGLPANAWFVLLHVREPGFHRAWHRRHPGTRNADIRTYQSVIDFVLSQGGWVVRGGDPTMTKLKPQDRVIDYATSPMRSPEIDILLCAECTYFVGTNSGFSVVPPIFGKRCALTNWSPIGIPNWYLEDLFIPKLVRRKNGALLNFSEWLGTYAGWSQFQRDFRNGALVIEDNSPEDLLDVVQEMHAEIFQTAPATPAPEDAARLRRFNEIALAHGGYIGSRMSYRFLEKYKDLLA